MRSSIISLLCARLIIGAVAEDCTRKELRNLNLDACYDEVVEQYSYDYNPSDYIFNLPPFICFPKTIYFMPDVSKTVRRSVQRSGEGEDNLLTIQKRYIETFVNWSQSNSSWYDIRGIPIMDDLQLVPYAAGAKTVATSYQAEAFLELLDYYLLDGLHAHPAYRLFFFGKNRGWSRTSQALDYVRSSIGWFDYLFQPSSDELPDEGDEEEIFDTGDEIFGNIDIPGNWDFYEPFIVLITDGRPENINGHTNELKSTRKVAKNLKKNFGAHIHCVLTKMDKDGREFWNDKTICDSKQVFETTAQVTTENFLKGFDYFTERLEACEDYFPATAGPTDSPTNPPSAAPTTEPTPTPTTTAPTTSPVEPCDLFQQSNVENVSALDFENSVITLNNLGGFCGIDAVEGENCGENIDPVVIYNNLTELSGELVHLIVRNTSEYNVVQRNSQLALAGEFNIGKNGAFGQIPLQQASNVALEFEFVKADGSPAVLPVLDFTVFDLDQTCTCNDCDCTNCELREAIIFDKMQFTSSDTKFAFFEDSQSSLCKETVDDLVRYSSTIEGDNADNPSDPILLDAFQRSVSLTTRFYDVSTFSFTYEIVNGSPEGGRKLNFAGQSSVSPCDLTN